jgi:hypothetical protein
MTSCEQSPVQAGFKPTRKGNFSVLLLISVVVGMGVFWLGLARPRRHGLGRIQLEVPREGFGGRAARQTFSIGVGERLISDWQREIYVMAPLRGSLRQQT